MYTLHVCYSVQSSSVTCVWLPEVERSSIFIDVNYVAMRDPPCVLRCDANHQGDGRYPLWTTRVNATCLKHQTKKEAVTQAYPGPAGDRWVSPGTNLAI